MAVAEGVKKVLCVRAQTAGQNKCASEFSIDCQIGNTAWGVVDFGHRNARCPQPGTRAQADIATLNAARNALAGNFNEALDLISCKRAWPGCAWRFGGAPVLGRAGKVFCNPDRMRMKR